MPAATCPVLRTIAEYSVLPTRTVQIVLV
eukprot:COSAG01_NODE_56463_length_318_cov_0.840183_1_plen_28_part_01